MLNDDSMKRLTRLSIFAVLLTASPAMPCGFHNYAPQPTMVEHMLGSSSIVLARQSENSPFAFEAVELLSGRIPSDRIPFLVDTATRRKLAARPDVAVLFSYDEYTKTWQRLALVEDSIRPVVDEIIHHLPAWRMGDDPQRADMFSLLLDHPDQTIRRLALRELDRVDYGILRALWLAPDTSALLDGLTDPMQRDLVPIRALLLGLSRDPAVAAHLARGVANNRTGSGPQLGAYATAWIELQGTAAIESLTRTYLGDRELSKTGRELIIEALAIHSSYGDAEVVQFVNQELSAAILRDPSLAVPAARQFMGRYDWSLHDAVAQVSTEYHPFTAEDAGILDHYRMASAPNPDFSQ